MVNSKYPLLCLVTDNLEQETINILQKAKISYKVIKPIPVSKAIYENNLKVNMEQAEIWKYTLTKFFIWTLTEFEKIIFLDADLLIMKNLDHCFEYDELTAAIDGEYFNLWPNDFHFNSGFMVIKPNTETFSKLLTFANNIKPKETLNYLGENYVIADQDILNMYFTGWKETKEKQLNKYYNIFPLYIIKDTEQELIENSYFVHFVGFKPWKVNEYYKLANTKKTISSYFYCLAAAIIEIVKETDYEDIDWSKPENVLIKAIYIARNKVVDLNTARLFIDSQEFEETSEVREALLTILKHIYKKKITSGIHIANNITSIEVGDVATTYAIYKLIEKTFVDFYKKY